MPECMCQPLVGEYKKNKRRILQIHRVFRGYRTAVNRCFEGVLAVIGPPEPGEIPHFGAIFSRFRATGQRRPYRVVGAAAAAGAFDAY